jgi:hypothetical protein
VVFKDLQKLVVHSQQQEESTNKKLFRFPEPNRRLQGRPFWIWNIDDHRQEDIRTNGDCCFNHIIGLPQKDGIDVWGWKDTILHNVRMNKLVSVLNAVKCMTTI